MPYPDGGLKCPIAGCPRERGAAMLMCGPHWRKVPRNLQRAVYATWKNRLSRPGNKEFIAAHEDAKRAAIEAVEAIL